MEILSLGSALHRYSYDNSEICIIVFVPCCTDVLACSKLFVLCRHNHKLRKLRTSCACSSPHRQKRSHFKPLLVYRKPMVAEVCICEIQASVMFIITALYLSTSKRGWLSHVKKTSLKGKSKFALQVCGRTEREVVPHGVQPQLSHTTQCSAVQLL